MKWPDENQTWGYEKSTATQNFDVHHLTPRPKFGFVRKPERFNDKTSEVLLLGWGKEKFLYKSSVAFVKAWGKAMPKRFKL